MRILLDNNVHHKFATLLPDHDVTHVQSLGWESLRNGELLRTADDARFEVLITADKQMRHQQNLTNRKISVIVLSSRLLKWKDIEPLAPMVRRALESLLPSQFIVIHSDL
jgi:predicted nuclease of predicted toxin-antitoxin system